MPASLESRLRTRSFARVIGPYITVIPAIIAARAPSLGSLHFFEYPIVVWMMGALLFGAGLFIIANHQHWRTAPAVAISLFGWFLALRGIALLAVPEVVARGVSASMNALPLVRLGFGALAVIGLWLTFVGWIARPANRGDSGASAAIPSA